MTAFRDRSGMLGNCFGLMTLSAFYGFREINESGIKLTTVYKAAKSRLTDRKRIHIRMNDVINRLSLHYKRRNNIIN